MEVDSSIASNSSNESVQSDSDVSADGEQSGDENEGNPGLADALAKVIRMSKNKKGKSIVLSKAKLYDPNQTKKKKINDFDIEPDPNVKVKNEDEEDVNPKTNNLEGGKQSKKKKALKKQERLHRGRLKPSPLDKEKEKPLQKIATKGVVQLFNAVRQQQSKLNKQIHQPGVTESKKEKILKSIDKNTFLEVLRGKSIDKLQTDKELPNDASDEIKEEPEEDEEPSWHVLRDDFMMGAKLKDWDKNEIEVE